MKVGNPSVATSSILCDTATHRGSAAAFAEGAAAVTQRNSSGGDIDDGRGHNNNNSGGPNVYKEQPISSPSLPSAAFTPPTASRAHSLYGGAQATTRACSEESTDLYAEAAMELQHNVEVLNTQWKTMMKQIDDVWDRVDGDVETKYHKLKVRITSNLVWDSEGRVGTIPRSMVTPPLDAIRQMNEDHERRLKSIPRGQLFLDSSASSPHGGGSAGSSPARFKKEDEVHIATPTMATRSGLSNSSGPLLFPNVCRSTTFEM